MPRDIRFRAWDTAEKCWIPEDAFHISPRGLMMTETDDGEWVEDPIDYVLEQFTGLNDKNGREIYEGDILALSGEFDEGIGVFAHTPVVFVDGAFTITDEDAHTGPLPISQWIDDYGSEQLEVVGNIHENPELLK